MTEFEKYLQEHKEKMDIDHLNPEIWMRMEGHLPKPKSTAKIRKLGFQLMTAAAIFFLGFFSYQTYFQKASPVVPEYLLTEYGFEHQNFPAIINDKMQLIRNTPVSMAYKNDLQLLLDQATYLDEHYQESKQQFLENGYDESLAKKVLKYYHAKGELLDKIIYEIEKINKNEKEFNIQSEKSKLSI